MVYVSDGQVLESRTRSPWSLSFLSDLFWGAVEFIGLFSSPLRIGLWEIVLQRASVHRLYTQNQNALWVKSFQSLVQPDLFKDGHSSASSRFSDGRGPPGFPGRRRMGRINHGAGPTAPPMGGGG